MVEKDKNNEINELIATYNALETQLKALLEQKNRYSLVIEDLNTTKESLENLSLETQNHIVMGGIVAIPVKVEKESFLVNIGSNVMVELSREKTIEFVKERIEFLKKEMGKLDEIIRVYQDKMSEIAIRLQKVSSTTGK